MVRRLAYKIPAPHQTRKLSLINEKTKELAVHSCESLRRYSELLGMVKTHQDQYESNNSALDTKLAEYQSRGTLPYC
jgi:hypothetical protein